jgi:hypothetical protein
MVDSGQSCNIGLLVERNLERKRIGATTAAVDEDSGSELVGIPRAINYELLDDGGQSVWNGLVHCVELKAETIRGADHIVVMLIVTETPVSLLPLSASQ